MCLRFGAIMLIHFQVQNAWLYVVSLRGFVMLATCPSLVPEGPGNKAAYPIEENLEPRRQGIYRIKNYFIMMWAQYRYQYKLLQ